MKKQLIALALLLCMSFGMLTGCSESQPYDYDLSTIVSLEKDGKIIYEKIELSKKEIDEELQKAIDTILDANAVKHEQNKDDATQNAVAEDQDTVNIDYKGVAIGKTLTEFSFNPAKPNELPTDLKDKLLGHEIGSGSKDAPVIAAYEVTLPEGLVNSDNTTSDFAGKTITLTVYKIHSVTRTIPATETEKEKTEEVTTGAVEANDIVKLDLSYTFKEPVAFKGGTTYTGGDTKDQATGYDLKLGSGSFVDDFEDQLVGKKLGETVAVNVTFPASYSSNPFLENMDVEFTTVLNYLSRSPKELTDKMVEDYTTEQREQNGSGRIYTSAETYKTEMRETIVESKAFEKILGNATVLDWESVPELRETYDAYWDTIEDSYQYFYQMGYFTGTYNAYLVSSWPAYYLFGFSTQFSSPDALASYINSVAKEDVKRQLVLHAIAQTEEIELTEEMYNEGVTRMFAEYKTDEIDTEKKFVKNRGEDNIRRVLKLEKVYELLRLNVVETEESADETTAS